MAGLKKSTNVVPQEDGPKMRRTIQDRQCFRTADLLAETSGDVENPQCLSTLLTLTIQRKQHLWDQLQLTTGETQ